MSFVAHEVLTAQGAIADLETKLGQSTLKGNDKLQAYIIL